MSETFARLAVMLSADEGGVVVVGVVSARSPVAGSTTRELSPTVRKEEASRRTYISNRNLECACKILRNLQYQQISLYTDYQDLTWYNQKILYCDTKTSLCYLYSFHAFQDYLESSDNVDIFYKAQHTLGIICALDKQLSHCPKVK